MISEKEFLEILKQSIQERLRQLSDILNQVSDTETKNALTENHQKSLEELVKVSKRLRELG
jgi:Mg2+/Co2+ transporter CorC